MGPEVADLATLVDFAPDPEQRLGLDLLFALNGEKSAAFEFAVICARQNLKTGLLKQAALGWLFVTEQQLVVWSAHEFSTAKEAFRDMENLIGGSEYLSRRVKRVYRGSGTESIELATGQRLIFKARTHTGGRGLSGDKVVLDEAFALTADHMGALLPTLSVRPDPQVVYASSAGLANSAVLRGVRDRGRPGLSSRLAYVEWCAPEGGCAEERCDHALGSTGCVLDDERAWRAGNPLLGRTRANGTGLTVQYVADERQALKPSEFARERLGWWDRPAEESGITLKAWSSLADADSQAVDPVAFAVDVSWPDREWSAIAVAGRERAQACGGLFDDVRDDRLRHLGQRHLDLSVEKAVTKPADDAWVWSRKESPVDISPLWAVTLARHAFAAHPRPETPRGPWALRG